MANEKAVAVWKSEWIAYKKMVEEAFATYVSKSSDLVRQLALAGIAIVWIFRETTKDGAISIATELRWAAALFISALALDLAHYLWGTYETGAALGKLGKEETKMVAMGNEWPHEPSRPPPDDLLQGGPKYFFYAKTLATLTGAIFLLYFLAAKI